MFQVLPSLLLLAISLSLVQDFLLHLFDVLTDLCVPAEAELLSGSASFIGPHLFLFLLFSPNKVLPVLTSGVAGLSTSGLSSAIVDEAILSVLQTSLCFVGLFLG